MIFKDKASDRMNTYTESCLEYINLIKNSFFYEYLNGLIEDINRFAKVLRKVNCSKLTVNP